ncbi:ribosome biogenesis protein BRX1 homolog [Parasteatoda tepidariorum]|uniref:ribosome biogenesis protein BRX1 homolog n=1 Tax=Parasteatoda tepidariorum TaxID=114398 RepID=UPI001C7247F3|nr:ribosome biogenesis protein BRX1 homolog [Parasteatoda tepidariorum]XP_042897413.1 ribosome biogenesis protein BRX1 homolog [Parasteatoda tepidariorum]
MGKRKLNIDDEPATEATNENADSKKLEGKWKNKQRILIFASRGISFRDRHLMTNLRTLLPHSKPDSKMDKKSSLLMINEICEMKNCNQCIYFENKKRSDLYMWISKVPNGPSAKFLVENVHTMEELKLTGNCLKGSRPILSFDSSFETEPHLMLLKELFTQVFGTPKNHPKSQPFFDHVFNFKFLDNRIWFRNYQIESDGTSLVEIGPRFVLNLIKVFDGSFCGSVLYTNVHYITPSMHRRKVKLEAVNRYKNKFDAKKNLIMRRPEVSYHTDPYEEVFQTVDPNKDSDDE